MIRDSIIGEVEIKRKNTRYLPRMDGQNDIDYASYLDRAVFFNMSQRTLTGLLGTLFRRNAVVQNLPDDLDISNISKQNQSLGAFVKEAAKEIITMGRYGVLMDMDENGNMPPYFAGYIAENITDWTIEEINGRWTCTEIILRELRLARPILNPISLTPAGQKLPRIKKANQQYFSQDTAVTRAARRWIASYRVLRLEKVNPDDPNSDRIYKQYYHTSDHGDASPEGSPFRVYTPTWRGKPFDFIPFHFLGPYDLTPDIDKSPLLDIILLNHSHYKSYAQLEHGRFYTALPVYYCPRDEGEENAAYTVGPSVVWEVGKGEKPGIIEFNGSGLKYLESACDKKEDQIAALGGRLVGVERVSAGESNNQLKVKEANENALLLNVANVLDTAFTALLRWWAYWQDVPQSEADKILFETNKDFLLNATGAREFRAIQMMYEAGIIPLAVLHDYLKRAELVPDWMSLDQFQTLLTSADSFPNQADVQARQRGAPNAATEWEAEHVLVDPQVVAVRGYDSQAPLGQQPLPGQTQGGATTAAETMPQGMGAPPPPPPTPAGTAPAPASQAKTGAGITRRTTVKKPAQPTQAAKAPATPPAAAPTDDVGTGGTPGGAPGGPLGSDGKHPRAQNAGSGEVADLNLAMNTTTL
jgi:hypothetical protein